MALTFQLHVGIHRDLQISSQVLLSPPDVQMVFHLKDTMTTVSKIKIIVGKF